MAIVSRKDHISFLHNKIGELTSHADFWDTTLICSDGTMCQSKLVAGLVFPELHNSSRFDTSVEPTIMVPDLSTLEVQAMIDSLFDPQNKPPLDSDAFNNTVIKSLVKVELEQDNEDTEDMDGQEFMKYQTGNDMNNLNHKWIKQDQSSDFFNQHQWNYPGFSWPMPGMPQMAMDAGEKPKAVRVKRTCEYKLQAVSQAKMTSNHAAARALGLEESTVRHWRRNEEKLKEQMRQGGGKRFRLAGGGNKQHHKELEEELAQWVLSHQNVKKVTQTEICKQALAIYRRIYEGVENKKEFNASKGWLYRFLSRNNLVGSDIISFHERKEYDDDEKDYSCDQCGKRFLYESSLRTHMSTHTGEKPHVCSYCAKTFRLRKDMIIHERIHTGERPYSCHVCGKTCYDSSNLRKHEKCHEFKY